MFWSKLLNNGKTDCVKRERDFFLFFFCFFAKWRRRSRNSCRRINGGWRRSRRRERERKNATQCAPHSQHWRLLKPIISSVISLVLSHLFTYFFPFRVIISSIFIASSFILIFSPHLFFPFLLNRHLLHGSYSFIFARSIPFSYFYLNESNIQLAVFISFQINFIWIRLFKTARFFNPHDANICYSCLTFHQFKHSRAVAVSKLGLRVVFFLFVWYFLISIQFSVYLP